MPRFTITAEFGLQTSIEAEVSSRSWNMSEVEEFGDNSYWESASVDVGGGSLEFVVEAEDESDAEMKANDVVFDGQEIEDDNGLTWEVVNLHVTAEAVELSRDQALVIVRRFLDRLVAEGTLPADVREAFDILIQDA